MKLNYVVCLIACFLLVGCRSARQVEELSANSFRLVSYNVNWGGAGAEGVAKIIRESEAEIVCLQETTPDWEGFLRRSAGRDYPFEKFKESKDRMGGGLAFLSKVPAREVAYIPSETGWV